MTHLIASIHIATVGDAEVRSTEALRDGASAVELRIDGLRDSPDDLNQFLRERVETTWIVTCRSRAEGGGSSADAPQRASIISDCVRGSGAFVDFEFADWKSSSAARELIGSVATSSDGAKRLILSAHSFDGPFEYPERIAEEMLSDPSVAVAKIAYAARTATQSLAALDLMHRFGHRVCAIAMGACGSWVRLISRKFGAWGTYATLDAQDATAPGQLTVRDMIRLDRWDRIGPATEVFGVIGDPVAHSMSPLLFNDWFDAHDVDAVYVPLHVPGGKLAARSFLEGLRDRPWLGVRGLSVTLPHKKVALDWCGGGSDSMARSIGAVNTLVFDGEGARAFNTDCYAAIDSMCAALGCRRRDLRTLRADVLGAGGVARAIVYGLREYGCKGTIYGRTLERVRSLADEFGFAAAPWEHRIERSGEVVINATRVGMWPDGNESPLPSSALEGCRLVFDAIYNPIETRLLAEARERGVATLNGLDMFVRQAAMQFELWHHHRPDGAQARQLLAERLQTCVTPGQVETSSSPESLGRTVHSSHGGDQGVRGGAIVLVGLRGSGKSTVGRLLADRLGVEHIDTDARIVSESGLSIAEVFAKEGEAGFRRRERTIVEQVIFESPGVISVGGGAVLDVDNARRLRSAGTVVWLRAPAAELWKRISIDTESEASRPPLSSLSGAQEMEHMARIRAPVYQGIADLTVDTSGLTSEQVVQAILVRLNLKRDPGRA